MTTLYASAGRIVHGFYYHLLKGSYVMDDFGNSVRVDNDKVSFFLRGAYASKQEAY